MFYIINIAQANNVPMAWFLHPLSTATSPQTFAMSWHWLTQCLLFRRNPCQPSDVGLVRHKQPSRRHAHGQHQQEIMMTLRVLQHVCVLRFLLYCTQLLYTQGATQWRYTISHLKFSFTVFSPHTVEGDFCGERWEQTRTVCIPSQVEENTHGGCLLHFEKVPLPSSFFPPWAYPTFGRFITLWWGRGH